MKTIFTRFHIFLSHHSYLYATIAGIGIVLFWRGVWHSADLIHLYIDNYHSSLSTIDQPWWDGPLSFVVGCLILYVTRAFVSSFIGNELILSGLRTEKRITKETESELKTEVFAIDEIKQEMNVINQKLGELELNIRDHHTTGE